MHDIIVSFYLLIDQSMIKPTNGQCASSEASELKDWATAQSDYDSVSVECTFIALPRCVSDQLISIFAV